MENYVIGAGAVLVAGPCATIAGAALHAQTEPAIAGSVQAALVDFEATRLAELSRVVILAAGWSKPRFEREVTVPLLARREVSLAEVLTVLALAAGCSTVHLFARWLPDEALARALQRAGVTTAAHPLEAIRQAALITGESYRRWQAPLRAA
jgi:hypothetical protein